MIPRGYTTELERSVPRERSGAELLGGAFVYPAEWRKSALAFGGLSAIALVIWQSMSSDEWEWLTVICVAGLAIAFPKLVQGLKSGTKRLITDPFLVLVAAFSMYFLFGPLLLSLGPEEQAAYALSWYPTDARRAVLVTAMNILGLAIALFTAGFMPGGFVERQVQAVDSLFDRVPASRAFWVFLVIGGYCTFHVVQFDLASTEEVVSGVYRTLGQALLIAILIGAMSRGRGAVFMHIGALLIAAIYSASGLVLFNKSAFLFPWLILLFGTYLRRPSKKWIVLMVLLIGVALAALTRPIGEARVAVANAPDIQSRWSILESVAWPGENAGGYDSGSGWWSRLCYTVAQNAAVDLYDRGNGGDDAELLAWVLVPRALFPQKPVITRSGVEFNEKVTGYDSSSSGMGIFISGYYNWGWIGLILVSAISGVLMAIYAAAARGIVACGSILLFPIVFLGALTAFRVDGHFVADVWGAFAMVMVPLLALGAVLRPPRIALRPRTT